MSIPVPAVQADLAPDDTFSTQIGLIADDYTGRMLMAAGLRLGHRFHHVMPAPSPQVAATQLNELAQGLDLLICDARTPVSPSLEHLAGILPLYPSLSALQLGQDRFEQRLLLERLDIPTFPIFAVDSSAAVREAFARLGRPAILKDRNPFGAQKHLVIAESREIGACWLLTGGTPSVLEPALSVRRELVLLAVRAQTGEIAYYPLVERHLAPWEHWIAPAAAAAGYQTEAATYAGRVLRELNYVGVLAIRYYLTDHRLVAAEILPGPHPAGYWTIEGASTSQYDNYLRAVLGQPLGSVSSRGHSGTMEVALPPVFARDLMELPLAQLHVYGPEESRLRRRGHVTLVGRDLDTLQARLSQLLRVVGHNEAMVRSRAERQG